MREYDGIFLVRIGPETAESMSESDSVSAARNWLDKQDLRAPIVLGAIYWCGSLWLLVKAF